MCGHWSASASPPGPGEGWIGGSVVTSPFGSKSSRMPGSTSRSEIGRSSGARWRHLACAADPLRRRHRSLARHRRADDQERDAPRSTGRAGRRVGAPPRPACVGWVARFLSRQARVQQGGIASGLLAITCHCRRGCVPSPRGTPHHREPRKHATLLGPPSLKSGHFHLPAAGSGC